MKLHSADPFADRVILAGSLATQKDRAALRQGVAVAREVEPGAAVSTDADVCICRLAETISNPSGTCRMGISDYTMSLADDQLSVIGLAGLRVIDASVMPTLVRGDTNAPSIMIREKAADIILGRCTRPPCEVNVFGDRDARVA